MIEVTADDTPDRHDDEARTSVLLVRRHRYTRNHRARCAATVTAGRKGRTTTPIHSPSSTNEDSGAYKAADHQAAAGLNYAMGSAGGQVVQRPRFIATLFSAR